MLSPSQRKHLRTLWDACATGGLNPSSTIEQLSYLLLLKMIEIHDAELADHARRDGRAHTSIFSQEGNAYRWSHLTSLAQSDGNQCSLYLEKVVFPWLRDERREEMLPGSHMYLQRAHLILKKPTLLLVILASIDALFIRNDDESASPSAIYSELLSMEEDATASSSKPTGRIFTPPHLARLLCFLVDLQADDRVWEPCCGNGHLLAHTYLQLTSAAGTRFCSEQLYGCDLDETCAFEAWMRLYLAGIQAPNIQHTDTLGSQFYDTVLAPCHGQGFATAVLANPPFSGVTDTADIGKSLKPLGTTKTELLFLEVILQSLQPRGRAAVIVPEGVLFGMTKAHRSLRHQLLHENTLHAVISLPPGTFAPWANVKTDILFFQRGGTTNEVWFYEILNNESFALSGQRGSDPSHDHVLDLLVRLRSRQHGDGQPPREIDPGLWRQWHALSAEEQLRSFIRPTTQWNRGEPYTGEIVRSEEEHAWVAAASTIVEQNLSLTAMRYKPLRPTVVEYPAPATQIRKLIEIEKSILQMLNELEEALHGPPSHPQEEESHALATTRTARDTGGEAGPLAQRRAQSGDKIRKLRAVPVPNVAKRKRPEAHPTSGEIDQFELWHYHPDASPQADGTADASS